MQGVDDLVRALYRVGLVQRKLAREAMSELGSQGFIALGIINRHGPVRISDVAAELSIDTSVASRQVAALESAGHVRREADSADGRAHLISATPAGKRVLRESHRRMVDAVAGALESWDEADVAALAAALDRLREDVAR